MKAASPEHYALVTNGEVAKRAAEDSWLGFVEPIGYGESHGSLANFIVENLVAVAPTARRRAATASSSVTKVLQDYRSFLVRDCGQMTIEGVRADMDIGQRRFDLERLFVPLQVLATPPDIPISDPLRDKKLAEWRKNNQHPVAFGSALAQHKRLALLALPGGGKTLLLKRLAVAYADATRRNASSDGLPDLDVTPVLIRCREWREHIHRPIQVILDKFPEMTGQTSLARLGSALIPLFKRGRVLLLVDGLDEIHDDALRSTFVDRLETFLDEYRSTRVVVTSREAGFRLVAPTVARFCKGWRIAPLDESSITELCGHWHRLMTGASPESRVEARQVANELVGNDALRRLAENPLLLTMLLVVKHGAGRLPPDRVSLYDRAIEVLLDTWNIKGHEPLSTKEAVPQLAYVAFEMMKSREQTATQRELLTLLEDARESVPQVRRYAKDVPEEFLKRVELRSSLVVEAGRQAEKGGTIPFYQFRHLTFQEYLAAVAAVEGHYNDYGKENTVLTPLRQYILAEDWKEVIPMAAVLAKKQAEPLVKALVDAGMDIRRRLESGEDFEGKEQWLDRPTLVLPSPIVRLLHCLAQEAEATQETITDALRLLVLFANGCYGDSNWYALCRGPYGDEILHQAWSLYSHLDWLPETRLESTCAFVAANRYPMSHWEREEGRKQLQRLIDSPQREEAFVGLFACVGRIFGHQDRSQPADMMSGIEIERHIRSDDWALCWPALWAWALITRYSRQRVKTSPAAMDRALSLWLTPPSVPMAARLSGIAIFFLAQQLGLPRGSWNPRLSRTAIQELLNSTPSPIDASQAICVIAFHSSGAWSDQELVASLRLIGDPDLDTNGIFRERIEAMLAQIGC
jgi:hypothetical protein